DFADVLELWLVLCAVAVVLLLGFFVVVVDASASVPATSSEHPSISMLRPEPTAHLENASDVLPASYRDGTEIIPRLRLQCQSRKCVSKLRKCSRQEDRSILPPSPTLPHQEDHVLTAFQSRRDTGEIIFRVHGLLVDFEDYVAARQSHVVGERTRLHVLHDHTLACRNVEPVGHFLGQRTDSESKLAFLRLCRLPVFLILAQAAREQLGAIGDNDGRFLLLAVANEAQSQLASRLAAGN